MKYLLSFIAALALASSALAVPVPTRSAITAVTVYGDRAIVTRSASLELVPGTHEFEFENLPATLVDQSLQVSGHGEAAATILDTTARQVFVETTPNERIRSLENELKAFERQVRTLDDRGRIVAKQLDSIERMLAAAISPTAVTSTGASVPGARPSLDEWRQLQSYYEESLGKYASEQQSLDRQREEIASKQATLNQQLAQLRGSGGRSQKTVTVRVDAAYAGKLQLAVTYTVPNASWIPAYDARLRSAGRTVELSYFGVVRQSTGEDWNNVELTLSTARPSLGGAAPELAQWVVNVWQNPKLAINLKDAPVAYSVINRAFIDALGITDLKEAASWAGSREYFSRGNLTAQGGTDAYKVESYDFGQVPNGAVFAGLAGANPDVQMAQAALNARMTSATFRIASPATIPANNSTQKVSITNGNLTASLQYNSTPKLREAVFLVATATNSSAYPLLAGPMNAFLDDVFIASSSVKTVMPGEKFDLALGADDGISVARRTVNRFQENTGLSNTGRRVTYEFLVTVTNNKKSTEKVTLREPLPVSRNEQVIVKLINPVERDLGTAEKTREVTREASGGLAWQIELKPGEKREVTLKFSVEHPADVAVVGLE